MEDTTSNGVSSSEEGCFVLTPENLPNSVFNELRKSKELVDVRLQVGKKELAAHRVVLAATIPYFRTMFTIEMRERIEHVITIEANIDESSFEAIVDYAYGGQICITSLNLPSLLVAASFFELDRLSKACCEIVKSTLSVSNVMEMHTLGDTLGHLSLVDLAQTFIREHFEEFAESESFLSLSSDAVIGIISKDDLNVTNEEKVFESVIKWVKRNENTRKHNLPNLLLHVRLTLMTPEYLRHCVFTEDLVGNSLTCRNLLDEALFYHLLPNEQSFINTLRCSALAGLIYAVGGRNIGEVTVNTVEVYNHKLNNWAMEKAMTSSREGLALAVIDRKLYAIGGYDTTGRQYLSTVEVFDVSAKRWTNVTSMNSKRGFAGAATLNDKLYVCGGWDGTSLFNTVECYDYKKDEWQMMPSMSNQRSELAVVAFQGSIVALGGSRSAGTHLDSVEMFDPKTQRWTGMPSMLTRRRGLGAAVVRNKIYVCGGQHDVNYLESAEVFDPESNNWSFIASMNTKREGVSLVAKDDKLYAFGGYDGNSRVNTVEMYNPEKNEWTFVEPMSVAKYYAGAIVF